MEGCLSWKYNTGVTDSWRDLLKGQVLGYVAGTTVLITNGREYLQQLLNLCLVLSTFTLKDLSPKLWKRNWLGHKCLIAWETSHGRGLATPLLLDQAGQWLLARAVWLHWPERCGWPHSQGAKPEGCNWLGTYPSACLCYYFYANQNLNLNPHIKSYTNYTAHK